MEMQFQGDADEFENHLAELAREYQDYQSFVKNRAAMFALAAELKGLTNPDDIRDKLEQFHDAINENVDGFIRLSHAILEREDKELAVAEWIKFLKADEQMQQAHMTEIIGFDTAGLLDDNKLPLHAWGYIKQHGLDTFDKYDVDARSDLDDEEDWITFGYKSRQEDRIGDILLRAPDGVMEVFDAIDDENPTEQDGEYSYIDAYTSHLPELADAIESEVQGLDFGPSERFMQAYYAKIDGSEVFRAYRQKVKYIDSMMREHSTKTPKTTHWAEQSDHILHSPAFLDGMRFAMIVNARMLAPSDDSTNLEVVDLLAAHTHDLFSGLIQEFEESDQDINEIVLEYGLDLFDANLAHPDEPFAKQINQQYNPLSALAETVVTDLYNLASAGLAEDNFSRQNSQDFYAGFGIGRTIYNAYRMDCIQQLEASFAD